MDTYKKEHRDSIANQPTVPYPAAAAQEYPLSSEFPDIQTYQDIHKNDPVVQSTTPTFPTEYLQRRRGRRGLVPGITGVAPSEPEQQSAVGATR